MTASVRAFWRQVTSCCSLRVTVQVKTVICELIKKMNSPMIDSSIRTQTSLTFWLTKVQPNLTLPDFFEYPTPRDRLKIVSYRFGILKGYLISQQVKNIFLQQNLALYLQKVGAEQTKTKNLNPLLNKITSFYHFNFLLSKIRILCKSLQLR